MKSASHNSARSRRVRVAARRAGGRAAWATLIAIAALLGACGEDDGDAGDDGVVDTAASDAAAAEVADDGAGGAIDVASEVAEDVADVAADDGHFDVAFPQGDGNCKPDCKGKVCGPDGCGSVCGFCPTGKVCAADGSVCKAFCTPDCEGKVCGDNGCGGDCGTCKANFHCGVDQLCYADDCVGSCVDKVCGDDGCGKSCGSCAAGDFCDPSGKCNPSACKGIPAGGECDGDVAIGCEGQGAAAKKTQKDCALILPKGSKVCGWDPAKSGYGCIDKPPCEPNCALDGGKTAECGDDGCGGSCGSCLDGWACEVGACKVKPGGACGGTFNSKTGACDGNTWLLCSASKVVAVDCTKANKTCAWTGSAYGCK